MLTDNVNYWLLSIPNFAESIRKRCAEKRASFDPGTFRVFRFIDNTMNATCCPGGDPTRDGVNAPRNDPLIQRAW